MAVSLLGVTGTPAEWAGIVLLLHLLLHPRLLSPAGGSAKPSLVAVLSLRQFPAGWRAWWPGTSLRQEPWLPAQLGLPGGWALLGAPALGLCPLLHTAGRGAGNTALLHVDSTG